MNILFAAQAVCAISLPFQKLLLAYSPPLFLTGCRMIVAGVISLCYARLFTPESLQISGEQWRCYASGIVSGGYLKYVLKMWAISVVPVARVALLCTFSPFGTAAFSYARINERLTFLQIIGMVIGCAGIFVVMCNPSDLPTNWITWLPCSIADLAILGAVLAHCHGMMVTRTAIKVFEHSPSVVTGIRMLGGGIMVMITACIVEGVNPVTQWLPFLGGVVALVLISNIIGHYLYLIAYRHYPPTFISLSDGLSPILVAVYGWLLLGEPITLRYTIAAVIVMTGLAVYHYHERVVLFFSQLRTTIPYYFKSYFY